VRRVQVRVAANAATPVFPVAGLTGYNGVTLTNQAHVNGTAASNGNVTVNNNASATASTIGPSGSVTVGLSASPCTGSNNTPPLYGCVSQRTPAQGPFVPASIAFPTSPNTLDGNTRLTNRTDVIIGGGGNRWDPTTRSITLNNGGSVTLGGGTYDFCNLNISNNSTLTIGAAGVGTTIYIDSPNDNTANPPCSSDSFTLTNNSSIVNNSPPKSGGVGAHDSTALTIFVYDLTPLTLNNRADFYGTVYAPNSDVNVINQANTYGAVAGKTVTYTNNVSFYGDNNALTITTAGTGTYFRTGWRECQPQPTTASDPLSGC
jgi:hypothetical protein